MYWRTLKFDAYRSLGFLVDVVLTFALFRAHEFYRYSKKVESFWNWCFTTYLVYICFIGGFYILFVGCDIFNEIKKWRKRV